MSYVEQLFGKDALKSEYEAEYIDRSDLEAIADCPHQGQLLKKHTIEITNPLPVAGEIIHKIAEEAISFCDYNLQEAADTFAEELPKALGRTDLQPDIVRGGKNLANELKRFGANQILLCEEQITRSIMPATTDKGEILITTKPDLVLATGKSDALIVLDYKSGYKQRTSQEAKDAFQTATICWVLRGKYPEVNTIHFWYLETRTFSRAYARIDFDAVIGLNELTQEMAFQARLFEAVRLLDSDEAWPSESKCAMCPVTQWCKLCDKEIKDIAKNPKKYLDSYIVKQARCDEMLKAMKAFVKDGKVIYGSEQRFVFDPKPQYKPKLFKNDNGE
jgi:hypothetical protein